MDPDKRHTSISAGTIIGWCVLAAGIGQVPIIVAGLLTARVLPQAGLLLLILGLPSGLLLFLGGLGLICRQFAGYYCVYLATFFAGIGGFKSPYIPFIKRFVNFGPTTEDLFLALNLLLIVIPLETKDSSNLAACPHVARGLLGFHRASNGSIVKEEKKQEQPSYRSSERLSRSFKLRARLRT